jgi:hypothetical protein
MDHMEGWLGIEIMIAEDPRIMQARGRRGQQGNPACKVGPSDF